MPDGVTQPAWTPLEPPSFAQAQKHPIPVMGSRYSTTAVAGTMAPGVPSGGGNAQDNLLDDSIDGIATKLGPFKEGSVYEFTLMDDAAEAAGTPDNVHIRLGTDAELTAQAAIVSDYPWYAAQIPVKQIHFKQGQTHMSIIRAATGTKTMRLFATRLI